MAGSIMLHARNPLAVRLVEFVRELLEIFPTPRYTTFHVEVWVTNEANCCSARLRAAREAFM